MIESLDQLRSQVDSSVNITDTRNKLGQLNENYSSNNDYQQRRKIQRATSANANSIRNQKFLINTLKRPDSTFKQRFEHLTPRERERQRQEYIDNFKFNVMSLLSNESRQQPYTGLSHNQKSFNPNDPDQMMYLTQ